jgi:uncharacterized protein (TIGR03083 family)
MEIDGTAPILCAPLLRKVDDLLLDLLGALRPEEWDLDSVAPGWQVRDVAAHLLDTSLRKLSLVRDGWQVERPVIRSAADVAALVNRMNREGVTVYRRLSPALLISWMRQACRESADFHEALDPFAPAAFPVSWAGERSSLNWFDTARELTERWHHQQQIRLATGREGLLLPELYRPVLDCFLRGLPHALGGVAAAPGTVLRVEIAGDCGGVWHFAREAPGWKARVSGEGGGASVVVPQEIAWRVFTKGIPRDAAAAQIQFAGDRELGMHILDLIAIVA